jgi:uncharacterized protein
LATPLRPDERVEAIDAVRGAALFGVLVVNLVDAFRVSFVAQIVGLPPHEGLDAVAAAIMRYALTGKAVALFAFLFGLGLAVQWERRQAAGEGRYRLARRLVVLGVFGALHLLFIWNGDILTQYALGGLLLLPLLAASDRTLLKWMWALLAMHLVLPILAAPFWPDLETLRRLLEQADRIYSSGTWLEVRIHSWVEWLVVLPMFSTTLPETLLLFVAGMLAWRRGYFQRPAEHATFLKRVAGIAIPLGLLLTFLGADSRWLREGDLLAILLQMLSASLAPVVLSMGYGAGLLLLLDSARGAGLRRFLAPAGRMAFSNYIAQSLAFSWIFYGHGLGLYGRIGPAAAMALGIGFYLLQARASAWWLARHRYGPLEWLWRTLTYGRLERNAQSGA